MVKIACCGEHTTRSAHPEFLPEFPDRLAAALLAAPSDQQKATTVKNFGFATAVVCKKNGQSRFHRAQPHCCSAAPLGLNKNHSRLHAGSPGTCIIPVT